MKTININLIGDRPSAGLALAPELNIDPDLLITAAVGLVSAFLLPTLIGMAMDNFLIAPTQAEIAQLKTSTNQSNAKTKEIARIQKQAESLEGDYNTLLTLAKQSGAWKTVLEEVRDLTPTDMWLTRLTIEGGNKLRLEGTALDYRSIAFFYTNLQNAANFNHPVLGGLQSDPMGGQTVIRFTVDCDLAAQAVGG
ncbi:MAG TPA: PilN domain-containing protein [Stenomitos sp.]